MNDLTRRVEVAGQTTRVCDVGDGRPVVLLHGWGGRIESMAPVIGCLEATHRVVALDLPGFGESPVPEGAWGTADHAEFVVDVLARLGIERASFLGHSFGARTSLYVAATHPGVVERLVCTGSSGLRQAPSAAARIRRGVSRAARAAGVLGGPGKRVKQAVYRRIASDDYRTAGELRPMLVRVVNEDLSHLLPRVSAPTLLIWGTEDDAVPLRHGEIMERLIPDAGLVRFEGAGHFAYLEEPERFCRVVGHFLDEHSAPPRK
jgi:pimeloyl-ACP methyl ester carboxylesterase